MNIKRHTAIGVILASIGGLSSLQAMETTPSQRIAEQGGSR